MLKVRRSLNQMGRSAVEDQRKNMLISVSRKSSHTSEVMTSSNTWEAKFWKTNANKCHIIWNTLHKSPALMPHQPDSWHLLSTFPLLHYHHFTNERNICFPFEELSWVAYLCIIPSNHKLRWITTVIVWLRILCYSILLTADVMGSSWIRSLHKWKGS